MATLQHRWVLNFITKHTIRMAKVNAQVSYISFCRDMHAHTYHVSSIKVSLFIERKIIKGLFFDSLIARRSFLFNTVKIMWKNNAGEKLFRRPNYYYYRAVSAKALLLKCFIFLWKSYRAFILNIVDWKTNYYNSLIRSR